MPRHPLALAAALVAQLAFAAPPAPGAPREFRAYYIGNSLTDTIRYDDLVALAKSRGHTLTWGRQMTPGASLRWHTTQGRKGAFINPAFGNFEKALAGHDWDAVMLQPFGVFEENYTSALEIIDVARAAGRRPQFFVFAEWPAATFNHFDSIWVSPAPPRIDDLPEGDPRRAANWGEEARNTAYWGRGRDAYYDLFVERLRVDRPDLPPARLIPVGHSLYRLNQKARRGQLPGVSNVLALYSDEVHFGAVGAYLTACTFYATLFGETPIGLPVEPYRQRPDGRALTDALARIVKETAWEAVASEQFTGVASPLPLAFSARVTDAAGASQVGKYTLTVEAESKPAAAPQTLPAAKQGVAYSATLKAEGGNQPLRWRLARRENAPPGFKLTPDGRLVGTPVLPGSVTFKAEVVDADQSSPNTAVVPVTLAVEPGPADLLVARKVDAKAITLDGKLDEPVWKLERPVGPPADGVRFDVTTDGMTLYVAVRVPGPAAPDRAVDLYFDAFNSRERVYNAHHRRITIPANLPRNGQPAILGFDLGVNHGGGRRTFWHGDATVDTDPDRFGVLLVLGNPTAP